MPEQEPKYRVMKTIAAYSAGACLAAGCCVLGPTLVSMAYLLATDTTHMALALAGLRLGNLGGTLLCGICSHRFSLLPELELSLSCLGVAVTLGLAPWLPQVYAFISVIIIMGVALGFIDACLQPYVMNLWRGHRLRNSLLQGLHFNWSANATVLPFFISLFLVDLPESHHTNGRHNLSTFNQRPIETELQGLDSANNNTYLSPNGSPNSNVSQLMDTSDNSRDVGLVRWAYIFLSGFVLLHTLYIFIVYLLTRNEPRPSKNTITKPEEVEELKDEKNTEDITMEIVMDNEDTPKAYRNIILACLFFFAFLYQCVEGVPGGFLTAFCAQGLGWHLDKGAILTMVYWGMQGVGRLLSMLLSAVISPRTLLIINLSLLGCGYLLLQFVLHLPPAWMWVAMALAGLGLGSSLPSSYLWVSEYMLMTSTVSSTALAGTSIAGVLVLSLTGYCFDRYGPMTMVYMTGACGLAFILVFIGMQLWASYGMRLFKGRARENSEQEMDESGEDTKSLTNGKTKSLLSVANGNMLL